MKKLLAILAILGLSSFALVGCLEGEDAEEPVVGDEEEVMEPEVVVEEPAVEVPVVEEPAAEEPAE